MACVCMLAYVFTYTHVFPHRVFQKKYRGKRVNTFGRRSLDCPRHFAICSLRGKKSHAVLYSLMGFLTRQMGVVMAARLAKSLKVTWFTKQRVQFATSYKILFRSIRCPIVGKWGANAERNPPPWRKFPVVWNDGEHPETPQAPQ